MLSLIFGPKKIFSSVVWWFNSIRTNWTKEFALASLCWDIFGLQILPLFAVASRDIHKFPGPLRWASYNSVRPYSEVLWCVRGMYEEYYGIPIQSPNTFFSSGPYAEKSCHKPEHFSKTRWGFWHFMTLYRSSPPRNTAQSNMWTIIHECVVTEILCFEISFKFYWSV